VGETVANISKGALYFERGVLSC